MLARSLFATALLTAQAIAYESKFTRVVGTDGVLRKYFDLDLESKSVLKAADGSSIVP